MREPNLPTDPEASRERRYPLIGQSAIRARKDTRTANEMVQFALRFALKLLVYPIAGRPQHSERVPRSDCR